LPDAFKQYKTQILSAITPMKDIDGLGGVLTGLSSIDLIDFIPATPRAVLYLLDKYGLGDMKGKIVSIIGQSNIVGRPLIIDCVKR
jgi:methylenetetrahydrofolate dehydrogenase (NADP+)/methenyltetrahydrofolate cyclohydrolase